jgi:hypothetical protein
MAMQRSEVQTACAVRQTGGVAGVFALGRLTSELPGSCVRGSLQLLLDAPGKLVYAMMLNEVQKQQRHIDALERRLQELAKRK